MHFTDPVHRRFDGSIDFDLYRAEANALRGSAMQDGRKLAAALKVVAVVGALLAVAALAPGRQDAHACHVCEPATSYGESDGLPVWHRDGIEPSLY